MGASRKMVLFLLVYHIFLAVRIGFMKI